MFTGLIQDVGEVQALVARAGRTRLTIGLRPGRPRAIVAEQLALGESVAVDGCCLTVVERGGAAFSVEVSPESIARTSIGSYRPGTKVNLEQALRLSDRLGGHLVLGHVDGVGKLVSRGQAGDFWALEFEAPPEVAPWLLPKGSVAIDGISLTVNELKPAGGGAVRFEVMVIPETQEGTALGEKAAGSPVNLEGDVIGKYVGHLLGHAGQLPAGAARIDVEFLRRHGFA